LFLTLIASVAGSIAPGLAGPRQLQEVTGPSKPLFSLPDIDGAELALNARAGRVVLVHFFATWCEPCREELTSLRQLVERMPADSFAVVAVNVAEVPVRVRSFLEKTPVNFPVLLDANRAVTRSWDVSILPTTFVLDRDLTARQVVEGDVDWLRPDILAALEQAGSGKPLPSRNN
jgi:peroxiredoxin